MAIKKIIWVLPQKKFNYSGIYKYNLDLIQILKKNYSIKKVYVKNSKNIFHNFFNKTILLNNKLKKFKNKDNILLIPEEGLGYIGILNNNSFKKKIIIIHDIKKLKDYKKFNIVEIIKFIYLKINYLFLRNFDKIITVSVTTQKRLSKIGQKSFVIYNLFHKPKNKLINIINKGNSKKKILLNIGSEHSFKNIRTIIKAMRFLENYIFIKVGDPVSNINRYKNKKLIRHFNLENKVFLLNKVSQKRLYNLIYTSDIYIAPSYSEGFGRTTIEAQMLNKKIICSNIPINKEILRKTASYVNNFNDPYSWYKKILNDKSNNNKSLYKQNYSRFLFKKKYNKYSKLLLKIIRS